MSQPFPKVWALEEARAFLRALGDRPTHVALHGLTAIEAFSAVALAALSREPAPELRVDFAHGEATSDFARAIGLEEIRSASKPTRPPEIGRTVPIQRVQAFTEIESVAEEISRLLVPAPELVDTQQTVRYVLVELLRNVVQHSRDPLGAVVAAQRHELGGRPAPTIQVAVADNGVGVLESLQRHRPEIGDVRAALTSALDPHVSGTFAAGETGSLQNAGMGLFFIAEMVKLVGGRMLLASRGGHLTLVGDRAFEDPHGKLDVDGQVGFRGTLVAFEMPADEQQSYDTMIERIRDRARERTPQRITHRWLRFDPAPAGTKRILVAVAAEDTVAAEAFSQKTLLPLLFEKTPIELDFTKLRACTQSFVHALLFEALRLAWARKTPVFVSNVQPAVKAMLELLENYALGG